jgi:hypothetical protein
MPVTMIPGCGITLVDDLQNKIAAFLRARRGLPFCTDCIREEFASSTIENVICKTESLKGQIGFRAANDICTRCGAYQPVILAL